MAVVLALDVLVTKFADNKKQDSAVFCMTPANYGTGGYQSLANETAMR
jgi:hypothetical protein